MPAWFLALLWAVIALFCVFVALDPTSVEDWVCLGVVTFTLIVSYYLRDELDRTTRA